MGELRGSEGQDIRPAPQESVAQGMSNSFRQENVGWSMHDKMTSVLTTAPIPVRIIHWSLGDSNVTNPQLGRTVPMLLGGSESQRIMLDTMPETSHVSLQLQNELENSSRQAKNRCNISSTKPGRLSTVLGCEFLISTQLVFWPPYGVDDEPRRHWRGFSSFKDSFWLNPFAASSINELMLMTTSEVVSGTAHLPLPPASYNLQCIDVNDIDNRRER